MKPYDLYLGLQESLIRSSNDDDEGAKDCVRDVMDTLWHELSADEKKLAALIGEQLDAELSNGEADA